MVISIVLFIMLLIATIQDIKSRQISIIIFPITFGVCLVFNIIQGTPPLLLLAGGLSYGLFTAILAIKKKIGWGDCLLIAVLGGCLGWFRITEILIIACLAAVVYAVYRKVKKKEVKIQYPFAPFLLIGFVADMIYGFIIGVL